jgi:hypothetical protein
VAGIPSPATAAIIIHDRFFRISPVLTPARSPFQGTTNPWARPPDFGGIADGAVFFALRKTYRLAAARGVQGVQ